MIPDEAYPLAWPAGWPRTAPGKRTSHKFHRTEWRSSSMPGGSGHRAKADMTINEGIDRVLRELRRLKGRISNIVISSDLELRRDGLPRSGQRMPSDPGVSVYWTKDGEAQCMAIDIYDRAEGNLAAVAASIEAMRAIERHGGATVMNRAFQGFKALPATTLPTMTSSSAADILSRRSGDLYLADTLLESSGKSKEAFQVAKSRSHPDRNGGDRTAWDEVEAAGRVLSSHHGVSL